MNIVIVGAGKLGCKVAESLVVGDYSITVVDRNDKVLRKLSQHLNLMTINEDARKISVLDSIDISKVDYLLACTDSDESNIVIASFAKKLGCSHVIARVREPEHMNQFAFIKNAMDINHIIASQKIAEKYNCFIYDRRCWDRSR